MDSRQGARMPGVEQLQEVEGFRAAYLAQQDPVRAVTQAGFEQVADRDRGQPTLFRPRFKAYEIWDVNLDFCRVLNHQYTFVPGDESGQGRKQCRLAGSRTPCDQNVLPPSDHRFEAQNDFLTQRPGTHQFDKNKML